MTDNDIKKALKLCATLDSGNCKKCPCREICNENDGTLTKLTLDLINRQKAEIERLQESGKEAVSCFTRMESLYKIKCKELEVAKSEAIKEFAERLKENCYTYSDICGYQSTVVDVNQIDNIVKEMTE